MTCFSVEQRQGMHDMVVRVAEALGAPEVSIDEHHWPKLYSRLLHGLLADAKIDPISSKRSHRSKTKSQSPRDSSKDSLQPSPAMPHSASLSPPALPGADQEMYNQQTRFYEPPPTSLNQNTATFPMNAPDYFVVPPLPFDSEMLESMHSLTNSWVLPGECLNFTACPCSLKCGDTQV